MRRAVGFRFPPLPASPDLRQNLASSRSLVPRTRRPIARCGKWLCIAQHGSESAPDNVRERSISVKKHDTIRHSGDAWNRQSVGLSACLLIVASYPTGESDLSAIDAHVYSVARYSEVPVKCRHDRELNPLVAAPLPIVRVVCPKLESRRGVGRTTYRNVAHAHSLERLFPKHRFQLMPPCRLQ
jgi:hypothetical protein